MKKRMVNKFFAFMNERHTIYLKRLVGQPPPWTKDHMLATYRFTNVFRRHDRVTEYYMDKVYKPNHARPNTELVFNTALFRAYNWPPTWEQLGWQRTFGPARGRKLADKLVAWGAEGNKVFTGAYMVRAENSSEPKAYYVMRNMESIWRGRHEIVRVASETQSMEETTKEFMKHPAMGGFTSYEVVCDLQYTKLLVNARDTKTWANPGPGAVRGLNRIRGEDINTRTPRDQCIAEMVWLLGVSGAKGGWKFAREYPLQLREIEHSLCEFDKYCRGSSRSKYRPETRF